MNVAALIALGVAVGVLVGLAGSSGVAVTVPALSYMGLTYQQSVGVSLLVDLMATASALAVYLKAHDVDYRYALVLGLGSIVGAQLGSHIAVMTPEPPLELLFAASSLYLTYTSLENAILGSDRGLLPRARGYLGALAPKSRRVLAIASSVGVGIATGLVGASGGVMFAAVLSAVDDMPIRKTVGTAATAMALSATGGVVAYFYLGQFDLSTALIVGASALASGFAAARLAHIVRTRALYSALSVLFATTAVLEVLKALA